MTISRKLSVQGAKSSPFVHFSSVLEEIGAALEGVGQPDPNTYQDTESDLFACHYLSYNLLRKVVRIHGTVEQPEKRRRDTLTGFLARELTNNSINQHESWGYDTVTGHHLPPADSIMGQRAHNVLLRARDYIKTILGTKPNMDRIVSKCAFGNGASATLVRTKSQDFNKFLEGCSVTTSLKSYITKVISTSPAWSELVYGDPVLHYDKNGNFNINPNKLVSLSGGVLDYVPKDASIDRIIIKEPELNGFVQRGIGREMRDLLKKPQLDKGLQGVCLNSSGDINSGLAKLGSVDGNWATVDAERASDSLTLALYELLFPEAWYKLLCVARSPYVLIDGRHHRLEMMSGMGNGFTFEAESIIFYAIGLAASEFSSVPFAEAGVCIHGDDLVVPSDVFTLVSEVYKYAGIVVNSKKSFATGPFRESCGGHWFNGNSVKPFYVKAQNGKTRGDWFWLYNSLLLWLNERNSNFLKSPQGVTLISILQHIRWYASSGNPALWRSPVDASRRSGLFSNPPKLHGGSWKSRNVVAVPVKEKTDDTGAYLRWLNQPKVRPTVYSLLFSKREAEVKYEFDIEVREVDRFIRRVVWNGFSDCGLEAPLWLPRYSTNARR